MVAPSASLTALLGPSPMAGDVRDFDWSATSLGPIADWPASLLAAVALILRAPAPMFLMIGDEGIMICNDGCAPIAGGRLSSSLGAPAREAWPEIAEFSEPALEITRAGGSLSFVDRELAVRRDGAEERIWISVDYSPLPDAEGRWLGALATLRETTEQVRLRTTATSERERLARMFAQAPGFMTLLSGPDHVIEFVNSASRKLTGHRDMVGRTLREGLPELEGQGFFELLDQVYASGEPFVGENVPVKLRPEPGAEITERILNFVYQPLLDTEGRTIGIFIEGTDVTDRLAAEGALRESEERFRLFADTLPNHLWSTRPDGQMEWFNDRLREYFGIGAGVLLKAEDWPGLVHPDDTSAVFERWGTAVAAGESYEVEGRFLRADGAWRWHLVRAVPLFDAAGQITRWIGTNTDIDDGRRATAALHESEARLRLSQEAAGIASLEVDVATGEVIGSDTLWALWGLSPRKSAQAPLFEALVLPEDANARSHAANRGDGTAARQAEYRIRRADTGEIRWLARHIEFIHDAEGRPVKMFGVMRDITDAKEAEARQRLLSHELAHRIKNILATVLAIASQTLRGNDMATARTLLTQRLQALGVAHDLLNRGQWITAPIHEVVETALAPFRPGRIEVEGPQVAIGPRRALSLTLAVNELATNALKYGALSGNGTARLEWARETGADGTPVLVLTWSETNGPPVSPPERRGFGRMLLERVLAGDFDGEVRVDFSPSGVRCRLVAPWVALSETRGQDA